MKSLTASITSMTLSLVILSSCHPDNLDFTKSGNWISRSDFGGTNRSEAVVFVINDIAYTGTGQDVNLRSLKDFWSYDPSDNSWFQLADLGKGSPDSALALPRFSGIAFSVNGKGYVGTGYDNYTVLKDFWEYDPVTNAWAHKADFASGNANSIPRYDAVGFAIGNYGYVGTGTDGNGNFLKDFWEYYPANDTWTPKVTYGGAKRKQAVAFVYKDKAYLLTGANGSGSAVTDFWMFDPSKADAQAWTELRHITDFSTDAYDDTWKSIVRSNAVAFVLTGTKGGDKAYLSTGNNAALTDLTWEYDFVSDSWTQKTSYEGGPREGAIAFTVKNRGFVALGRNSTASNDDTREFHPDELQNPND